ncbi:hypothetical protein GCM10027084_01020 [Pseudoxanthomonas sangjuensis]|uniref:hypothetical protein n=1 Tax=Pseudoxanthomonas sangjuensis TaxID=1503750 RepID=UPI001390C4C5|nr:hypothetical protein [Pseudoxanthomonas sangjuensis]KAF1713351.1 hypothetical protein CSC71_08495 [Pseudoxanthomonas sangjuensis]
MARPVFPLAIAAVLAAWYGSASADGRVFSDGRFPGKTTSFELAPEQKRFIDYVHRCHKDNARTPYLFHLTPQQAAVLEKETGKAPQRFAIFDSTTGDESGVDVPVNVIVRYSEDRFEVPHELLASDADAKGYEVEVAGWETNPIGDASEEMVRAGKCPASR